MWIYGTASNCSTETGCREGAGQGGERLHTSWRESLLDKPLSNERFDSVH